MSTIYKILEERILVLDGAMGTMLQHHNFSEEDFRGEKFKGFHLPLKGNNDLLSLTQPEAIKEVHRKYLQCRRRYHRNKYFFGHFTIAMADYALEDWVYELNYKSAQLAKQVALEFSYRGKTTLCCRFHRSNKQNSKPFTGCQQA